MNESDAIFLLVTGAIASGLLWLTQFERICKAVYHWKCVLRRMTMKRRILWVALSVMVGFPVIAIIISITQAAKHGDWSGVQFVGWVLWSIIVAILLFALTKPSAWRSK